MNQEIKNEAIAVFKNYPNAKEVFVTADGQAFLKKDRAILHNVDFETVKRSVVMPAETTEDTDAPVKKTAAELIEFIQNVETIEELDALEKGEKRATVLAAITARKEALTTKQD